MKKVFLVFPDLPSLAEFILQCGLKNGRTPKKKPFSLFLMKMKWILPVKCSGPLSGKYFEIKEQTNWTKKNETVAF